MQRRQSGLKSGGRGPWSKNFDFLGKFPKNLDSFTQFHQKKSIFQGKFPKNLGFFSGNFTEISIFQVKFSKNFVF